jgi:hypothetical protein
MTHSNAGFPYQLFAMLQIHQSVAIEEEALTIIPAITQGRAIST